MRTDIDHDAYKPAAWRVDRYLDGSDDEDIIGSLRSHRLVFSNDKGGVDAMARTEKLDDYKVNISCVILALYIVTAGIVEDLTSYVSYSLSHIYLICSLFEHPMIQFSGATCMTFTS